MRSKEEVAHVLGLARQGLNDCEVARRTGIPRGTVSADSRGRIASLGVGRLTSVNPFAGKLAAHGDRPNVGAISLSGPRCRSTSSGLAALPHAFDPLVALGVHESSQRMVTAAANPTVSDCAVCRSFCQGPIRCQGRDAGKEERGSPAVVRVRFAA